MLWNVYLRNVVLGAVSAAVTLIGVGCSFRATQDFGADGTPSSRSVSSGLNIGIPGLRGTGAGGNSPDAGDPSAGGFGGGGSTGGPR